MDCGTEWKLSPSTENLNLSSFISIDNSSRNRNFISNNSFEFNVGASISDDSGIPLTNSSSADSCTSHCKLQICESDGDVSQLESLSNSFESGMNAENFNTLKKGPFVHIDPPPEFQDSPRGTLSRSNYINDDTNESSSSKIISLMRWSSQNSFQRIENGHIFTNQNDFNKYSYASDSFLSNHKENIYDEPTCDSQIEIEKNYPNSRKNIYNNNNQKNDNLLKIKSANHRFNPAALSEIHDYDIYYGLKRNYNLDVFQQRRRLYSPLLHNPGNMCNNNRPNSRNSLTSRLSSSHNSLNVNKPDDSIFITQAMSHDALLSREISDFYNVPVDSDIYASPIDMIKPDPEYLNRIENEKLKQNRLKSYKYNKKKRRNYYAKENAVNTIENTMKSNLSKHSIEPLHLTLEEVKQFYHSIYSDNDIEHKKKIKKTSGIQESVRSESFDNSISTLKANSRIESDNQKINTNSTTKKAQFSISFNIREKFCNIFRFGKHNRIKNHLAGSSEYVSNKNDSDNSESSRKKEKIQFRALPPLPNKNDSGTNEKNDKKEKKKNTINTTVHFTSSIEKIKDYGWYWGPLSSEAAEKVLSNEPDGSFIVRDSSDDHYIFSLSFKLNNSVRHVRIEQDQGTFSFGSYAKFKSQSITEFIEKAVEHSRSGRYLFFLHRRPEHGPMRVQLTNPVSRFKHVQSLQHMCRFVILKTVVRKDLIEILPLPRRMLDYLNYKHCYSEQIENDSSYSKDSEAES